jgi:hypothetical protein
MSIVSSAEDSLLRMQLARESPSFLEIQVRDSSNTTQRPTCAPHTRRLPFTCRTTLARARDSAHGPAITEPQTDVASRRNATTFMRDNQPPTNSTQPSHAAETPHRCKRVEPPGASEAALARSEGRPSRTPPPPPDSQPLATPASTAFLQPERQHFQIEPPPNPPNRLTWKPPEATLRPAPHRAGEVTEWPMVPAC